MELKELLLEIVDENSGGLKMNELLVDIMTSQKTEVHLKEDFIETIEGTIKTIPELEILEYLSLGPPPRLKQFIYRVLA